ncbi:MAG TPA: hypothetical protein VFZ61_26230, partial [Polyangiales bacterium]
MDEPVGGSELDAIGIWRKSVLERVLLVCFVILSAGLAVALHNRILGGRVFAIALLPGWLLVTASLWPRASLVFRQFALIAGMLTVAIGSVAKLGFSAVNGFCAHLMLVVMVALFMGRRA